MSTLAFTGTLGPLCNPVDDDLPPDSDGDGRESGYEGHEIGSAGREGEYNLGNVEAECGWGDVPSVT